MEQVIDFLSGGVPGGILVLLLLLLIVNLALSFFKSSKLLPSERVHKNQLISSLILLIFYMGLWLVTQPPKPQIRFIVLPGATADQSFHLDEHSLELAELVKRQALHSLSPKYLMHPWEWMYQTIGPDSVNNLNRWKTLAKRLKAGLIIQPVMTSSGILATVYQQDDSVRLQASNSSDLLTQLNTQFEIFGSNYLPDIKIDSEYLTGKITILNQRYDKLIESDPGISIEMEALRAEALVRRGLAVTIDREKAQYVRTKNPDFDQAKSILFKLINNEQDNSETAYWLGRIAVYDQDYTKAELFLKKALIDNPSDARIYHALGFLHDDRLEELGFGERKEILEKAVQLDPGYRDAVFQLAEAYYNSGTGTISGMGTTRAKQVISNFLAIQKNDVNILSLLASIELKLGYHDLALEIYTQIASQLPKQSNSYYNLGMVYFYKMEYKIALGHFFKAIEIDGNLNAFLYAGITYRMMGENQLALDYYRERIRRKTGDDDRWAREAMKGVRKILADTTVKNVR